MNQYVTGAVIKELRERNKMTQLQLAEKLGVSDKTISKWETGKGYPDITLLEPIAGAFRISVTELISGNTIYNANVSANMLRSKFYVCPVCGNAIHSMGEAVIHCHGILLTPSEAESTDERHMVFIERAEDEYYVRGCTALLDAIGGAIHHIGNIHKYAREEDVPEKTIFVITTDGLENASKRYSYRDIKKMIKRQEEKYGWEFLFLGANIDVAKESDRLGIRQDRAVRYVNDSEGIELNYEVVGCAMSAMRCMPDSKAMDGSWKEKIEKDFKKRGRR